MVSDWQLQIRYLPAGKLITWSCPKKVHNGLIPANIEHDRLPVLEEMRSRHPGWLAVTDGPAVGTHSLCVSISRSSCRILKHLQRFPVDSNDSTWHGEKGLRYSLPGKYDGSAVRTKLFGEPD